MISLSDHQLDIVTRSAAQLPPEKRSAYLERVAGSLQRQAGYIGDDDVIDAAAKALRSLSAVSAA